MSGETGPIYEGDVVKINKHLSPRYEGAGIQPVVNEGEQYSPANGVVETVPEGFEGFPIDQFTPDFWDRYEALDRKRIEELYKND